MKFINKLLVYIPRALPVGKTAFYTWSDRIIDASGNFADRDSMRFALATNLLHLGPQVAFKSDWHFIKSMRKAAANQVASQVFQDIKQKQKEQQEFEAMNKSTEDTERDTSAISGS